MRTKKIESTEIIENGFSTIELVALEPDLFKAHEITLNDGDKLSLFTYEAMGILLIYFKLNNLNQARMKQFDLLHLLSLYVDAVQEGVITEPKLKKVKDAV